MTVETRDRPVPTGPKRPRTEADVEAAFARATDPDTMVRLAVPLLCAILAVRPGRADAMRLLRGHLEALGDRDATARAAQFTEMAEIDHPLLKRAARALEERHGDAAANDLRAFLKDYPDDPVALRLLANATTQMGRGDEAVRLLTRALATAPDYVNARRNLVDVLVAEGRHDDALAQLDALIAAHPGTLDYRAGKAATLKRIRRSDEALALYDALLAEFPDRVELLIDYGNAQRGAGKADAAIAAYRRAVAVEPSAGRAWLSLAELKTVAFDEADIAAMQAALTADDLAVPQRSALHFALGRALEQAGRHADSFAQYASANALQRMIEPYNATALETHVTRTIALIKATSNAPEMRDEPGPIFVVGLPRSGSTLVEQILAAHPRVEATEELQYLREIANDLARDGLYPESLAKLTPDQLAEIRDRYLEQAAAHRGGGVEWFVDKAPANWQHIPLIVAAFPNARIVDARRHPLDCGFSNYTQRFGRGHEFAYSLAAIGHHYAHYVQAMQAIDAAWPGRVHRVHNEALIADPEGETRRLLAYVGVDFDPACLRSHENTAPVFSASSEQVKRPINRGGVDRWKPFATWLGPLKDALGPVLDDYPAFLGTVH